MAWTDAARQKSAEARRKKARMTRNDAMKIIGDKEIAIGARARKKVGINLTFGVTWGKYDWSGGGKGAGPRNTPLRNALADMRRKSRQWPADPKGARYYDSVQGKAFVASMNRFEKMAKAEGRRLGVREAAKKSYASTMSKYHKQLAAYRKQRARLKNPR